MRFIARKGLWAAIALQCGITADSVKRWNRVPPERVLDVERAIGRPAGLIRPDIHGRKAKHTETPVA